MLISKGVFKDFSDGSLKSVFEIEGRRIIEMTLLFNKECMDVVCVPTHHFCNLGCKMCHLTNNSLNKNMESISYDNFIEALSKTVCEQRSMDRRTDKSKILISFMGVGEPLLNLKLIEDVFIHEDDIKKLGYDEVSYAISTMMPNYNVKLLASLVNKYNKPLKLHFSLHTPRNDDRKELIPSTRVSVEEALGLLLYYRNVVKNNEIIRKEYVKMHRSDEPIEIHYTLINGVNDSVNELNLLVSLLENTRIPIKFIRFNPINQLEISSNEELWVNTLKDNIDGLRVKTYSPPGREIGSSCGEFTKHYYHEEIETLEEKEEFERWKREHQIECEDVLVLRK